jgi:hypothetical protein
VASVQDCRQCLARRPSGAGKAASVEKLGRLPRIERQAVDLNIGGRLSASMIIRIRAAVASASTIPAELPILTISLSI